MLTLSLRFEDGTESRYSGFLPICVGRAPQADLRLKAWRVAREHARLERRGTGIFIDDLGALTGTFVNGKRITHYGPLSSEDDIIIGPCLLRLEGVAASRTPPSPVLPPSTNVLPTSDRPGEDLLCQPPVSSDAEESSSQVAAPEAGNEDERWAEHSVDGVARADQRILQRQRLHKALLDALDLRRRDIASMSDEALRREASMLLAEIIANDTEIPGAFDRDELLREVVDEAVGLGPLEPLLADPTISEIMVNRHNEIFVERRGRLSRYDTAFSSEQAVLGVIDRIVSPLGRRIDESSPMVDARLPDGSRVNAIIAPIALRGACITIRKFPSRRLGMADLLRVGSLDSHMAAFLAACVDQRKNILVSGGTGSGKTTLLNVLSNCIPADERIVTIEDAAELQLVHDHLVTLEARPANLEGRGAITIRDLVRNALRMRPDRIVVGECRGAEAFDMLAAMNTGHEGSLTTLHANSPRDALARLETMILMASMDLPLNAVREHVSSSIDIIVQQARLSDGRRLITSIVQITGQESGRIQMQEIFRFQAGPPTIFEGCGMIPEGLSMSDIHGLSLASFHQCTQVNTAMMSI